MSEQETKRRPCARVALVALWGKVMEEESSGGSSEDLRRTSTLRGSLAPNIWREGLNSRGPGYGWVGFPEASGVAAPEAATQDWTQQSFFLC